ncbi:MAG: enoyl-CoA hydratase/isomerase family protein [Deltaproteobacteria bacterium]|nr:enoyl-CoA hydratase/isomerase family protein [Deltaproteobacteria bacterium]
MDYTSKPLPKIRPYTREFWEASKRGELLIQHCKDCDKNIFYPREVCPHCQSENIEYIKASGKGKLQSFSLVEKGAPPDFQDDQPYVICLVTLDEGVRLGSMLVGYDDYSKLDIGMEVEVVFDPATDELSIPKFKPVGSDWTPEKKVEGNPSETEKTVELKFENLRYEIKDRVVWLTIDNEPMRNALTDQIQQDLMTAFQQIQKERSIRAVVLTGAGDKAFSSGGDISYFGTLDRVGMWDFMKNRGVEVCRLIENLDKPVIAMVNGYCYAGGLELALCCDIIYASETAKFGLLETRLGVLPGWGGTVRLPRAIPQRRAKEMLMTAERIDAQEAKDLGLVNRVCPSDRLEEEVLGLLERMKNAAPLAIQACKIVINTTLNVESMDNAMGIERGAIMFLNTTSDAREGVTSFFQKRPPEFTGS